MMKLNKLKNITLYIRAVELPHGSNKRRTSAATPREL